MKFGDKIGGSDIKKSAGGESENQIIKIGYFFRKKNSGGGAEEGGEGA